MKATLTNAELAFVEHYLYGLMGERMSGPALEWAARTGTTGIDIGSILKEGERVLREEGHDPLFGEPTRPFEAPWSIREEALARNQVLAEHPP